MYECMMSSERLVRFYLKWRQRRLHEQSVFECSTKYAVVVGTRLTVVVAVHVEAADQIR